MPGSRWFAALYDRLASSAERDLAARRRKVVSTAGGRVLELGAGTGLNLRYYAPGVEPVVTEPSEHMVRRLLKQRPAAGVPAAIILAVGEALPFRSGSFDTVVGTLVMCSVLDQTEVLSEVYRVLTPGGQYRFMEHVRADGRFWRVFQRGIKPFWGFIGDGCDPSRDTLSAIRAAGFEIRDLEPYAYGPYPVRPHIVGVAVKR